MAFLDTEGFSHFWETIKEKLSGKVDKVTGKGLSTNDYTDEEKTKLANFTNYDDTEIKNNITTIQTTIDTKVDKVDGYSLVADSEIEKLSAITNPIKIKGRVDVFENLPTDSVTGDLYFVGTEDSENYEEYVFTANSKWEQIGTSQIDLSAYVLKEEGKGLSSNDYTDEEKTKLTSLENYTLASTSQSGLMSAADKTKLDGLNDTTPTKVTIKNPNTDYYDNWKEKYCWYIKSGNVVTLSLCFKFKDVSSAATWINIPSEIVGIEGFPLSCEISTPYDDNGVQRYTYKQGKIMFFSNMLIATDVAVDDTIFIYGTYIVL